MRVLCVAAAALMAFGSSAWAFCGFYVATEDQPLVNRASRVVLLHEGGHTVVTMASDVHGDPKQFALVIPVPTVIRREQVRIVKPEIVEHLADYTKPRLVKYYDDDPCAPPRPAIPTMAMPLPPVGARMNVRGVANAVTVEAAFSVAEYDIKVLAAADSDGLIDWLNANGYRIPQQAGPVIGSYLRQHMHFFVAKVNLERMADNPTGFLRPIRVDYDTPKFMLPIRLGTVNAAGPQDMIVLALTHGGRVETTNYRTIRMPTGMNVPEYVEDRFGAFYDAVFARQAASAGDAAVFEEYAWPIAASSAMCDPCSAPPLSPAEFDELGTAAGRDPQSVVPPLFVTRLHVRYDAAHFPEDLQFQETPDQESYQARYVLQVAWKGRSLSACAAGARYRDSLRDRWRAENATLASLTGWDPAEIRKAMVAHWEAHREN
jgi:hypothetical protein